MKTTSSRISRYSAIAGFAAFASCAGMAFAAQQVASVKVAAPASQTAMNTPTAPSAALPGAVPVSQLDALGQGDMVRVTVFRNPELTTEARVSERGTILFPMIGEVNIVGLTPSQAGQQIADKLRSGKYVVNPEVTVSLAQANSRQVSVLGNVTKPGRYPLDSQNARLTDLIATAGGITPTGSNQITIVSTNGTKSDVDLAGMFRSGDLTKNVALQPGDTVYVHKAPLVYVYGEVQKGGAYPIEPSMTVMQAIALGGGITPRGTQRGIKITRAGNAVNAGLGDPVQPDDVIYVKESLF